MIDKQERVEAVLCSCCLGRVKELLDTLQREELETVMNMVRDKIESRRSTKLCADLDRVVG